MLYLILWWSKCCDTTETTCRSDCWLDPSCQMCEHWYEATQQAALSRYHKDLCADSFLGLDERHAIWWRDRLATRYFSWYPQTSRLDLHFWSNVGEWNHIESKRFCLLFGFQVIQKMVDIWNHLILRTVVWFDGTPIWYHMITGHHSVSETVLCVWSTRMRQFGKELEQLGTPF